MKEIKAREILDMFLHKQCDLERTAFAYDANEVWEAVKIGRDALEKQTSLEVIKIYDKDIDTYWCKCPVCGNGINWILTLKEKYCPECGQKIHI